ncbi:uncharacterized protein RBU47_008672 [Passerculus sandwichensis]
MAAAPRLPVRGGCAAGPDGARLPAGKRLLRQLLRKLYSSYSEHFFKSRNREAATSQSPVTAGGAPPHRATPGPTPAAGYPSHAGRGRKNWTRLAPDTAAGVASVLTSAPRISCRGGPVLAQRRSSDRASAAPVAPTFTAELTPLSPNARYLCPTGGQPANHNPRQRLPAPPIPARPFPPRSAPRLPSVPSSAAPAAAIAVAASARSPPPARFPGPEPDPDQDLNWKLPAALPVRNSACRAAAAGTLLRRLPKRRWRERRLRRTGERGQSEAASRD